MGRIGVAMLWAFAGAMALAGDWAQNGQGGQGGHRVGAYDLQAAQPAAFNWARQSAHPEAR
jgi:hypothetical protein